LFSDKALLFGDSAKGGFSISAMAKQNFTKKALSPKQLLTKLGAQGLIVDAEDIDLAEKYFEFIGGYRLKGYWLQSLDSATKRFTIGRDNFRYLVDQVEFDEAVRSILRKSLEKVELAIRSSFSNYLTLHHSPHWFLDAGVFKPTNTWSFGQILRKIEDEVGRSKEKQFVEHYLRHYDDPYLPPSWVMTECVTLGFWSHTYKVLRDVNDRKGIAKKFGVDQPEVFESWLHTVTYLRNMVAHQQQLMKVTLRIAPSNYKGNAKGKMTQLHLGSNSRSVNAVAKVLNFLLNQTGLPHTLKSDLVTLFANYPLDFAKQLGFESGWEKQPGW
jgi:abortive infection bacteriophage resistance protein